MGSMQTTEPHHQPRPIHHRSHLDRYVVTFNEADGATRADLARAVFADDGRLVDPLIDAAGPEQIAAAIGELRDQMPGHSLARTTAVDAHHTHARFGWTVNGPDGTVAVAGIDVVTFAPDGRIQSRDRLLRRPGRRRLRSPRHPWMRTVHGCPRRTCGTRPRSSPSPSPSVDRT